MNYKTKILIDRFCGIPFVYGLNVLARILGFFLRIDHDLGKPIKTIAVCKFIGMGSIVQSIPLLKTLRKNYPDARIVFVTNRSNLTLFNFIPEVDEVFCISDKNIFSLLGSNLTLLWKLWKKRPDLYIDLEIYSNYSSVIATMSLSRNRMGFFKDDKTYRLGMYTHMMFFNIKSPVSQTYLQFARLLGCKDVVTDLNINKVPNSRDSMSEIASKLKLGELDNYIVVNPNASDLRLERRWPVEKFLELITLIVSNNPALKIVLIGDKKEVAYVGAIASRLTKFSDVIDSSGKLTLSELISLIANAKLLITNDTGPMHLAFALNTRTVSLFGPCSPQQYGGMGNTISIYKNVYCSPCVHEFLLPPCKGDNQCMKKIEVTEVYSAFQNALQSQFEARNFEEPDFLNSANAPLGILTR